MLLLKDQYRKRTMMSVGIQSVLIIVLFSETMAQLSFRKPPQGGDTVSFLENQAVGATLYTIQADNPAGNPPIYTVLSSTCESTTPSPTPVTPFLINPTDQLVVPAGGLDAESCSNYTFTFRVTAGTSSLDSGPLTILVTDINDNAPKFSKTSYRGEVWKNDGQGQIVSDDNIIATDPDVSKLPVTLSISGAQTTFAINTYGFVYVSDSSGLAAVSSPTVLTIQADDGDLKSSAALNITVHDNPCSNPNPLCQNGGTCNSTRGNYTCACLPGYDGTTCQLVDHCHINPCQYNGTCIYLDNDYNCSCVWPYNSTIPENKNCTIRVSTSTESTTTTTTTHVSTHTTASGVSTPTESTTTTNPDVSTHTTAPVENTTCQQNCKRCKKDVCCPKIVIHLPSVCVAAIIISSFVFALKK